MRKSETILSINNKENKIYTIKHRKSHKSIADTLSKLKNNFQDVAGDSIDENYYKKSDEHIKRINKTSQNCRRKVSILEKKDTQHGEKKRGLIYITHLPQNYNERKVKHYFKNIGKITNVKVYKSKTYDDIETFGYVEFEHHEVAKIAAEKMNNDYTFTGNIKAEYLSYENQPKYIFRKKNKYIGKQINKTKRKDKHLFISKTANNSKVNKKRRKNIIKSRQHLSVQCNLIPLNICNQIVKEIKEENESLANGKYKENTQSKNALAPSSKKSSNKSLSEIKSNRAILTKSLDSVKTLLEKNSTNSQNEETQTPKPRKVKTERPKICNKNYFSGKILRFKNVKNKLSLNSITIKRIARELIRKRGYPLITLKSGQKHNAVNSK